MVVLITCIDINKGWVNVTKHLHSNSEFQVRFCGPLFLSGEVSEHYPKSMDDGVVPIIGFHCFGGEMKGGVVPTIGSVDDYSATDGMVGGSTADRRPQAKDSRELGGFSPPASV